MQVVYRRDNEWLFKHYHLLKIKTDNVQYTIGKQTQYTENIIKPNISFHQGVRNVRFSDVFKGIKR